MGATLGKDDKHWLLGNTLGAKLNNLEVSLVEAAFDKETDIDILQINKDITDFKNYRKLALVKVILFPAEIILYKLFIPKNKVIQFKQISKLYLNLLLNKINLQQYRFQLKEIAKNSKI